MYKEAVKGTKWKLCYYLEKIILTPKRQKQYSYRRARTWYSNQTWIASYVSRIKGLREHLQDFQNDQEKAFWYDLSCL